ncbi:protein CURLY FLAG LEAF 1-like [Cornus florida]|uniref:protein CURLY FLAG LEAF 1-like n=1 Tax=Cornus florida TaxID=4283 RepID=UPI00289DC506|nr:protein CURLY FLAG LEAF 1-like [Cornus florida]
MVFLQTLLSQALGKTISESQFNISSKKRKWEDPKVDHQDLKKSIFNTELHLETPLPLEWQQCLDMKSGQIHFYNTRTQKRTSKDPRLSPDPEPPSPKNHHMCLDLELNLPCGSSLVKNHNSTKHESGDDRDSDSINSSRSKKSLEGLTRTPSWLSFEGDDREMVTAVCKRCHMLVMMCKSSPACPNCKFLHPPEQSPPNLFKKRCSLLC